jgi:hypothetical protein
MMGLTCDCLNQCGDDPRLRTGKSKPCPTLRDREHQEKITAQKQAAATLLCKKFNVTNLLDLILAQDTHIQRLERTS